MALVALAVGVLFIVLPIMFKVGGASQLMLVGFGVAILGLGAVTMIITRLYQKTSANEAFVRTGMGGDKAIIGGGALVVPVVHNMIPVNLETVKVEVKRLGADAIITGNKLRADVIARFYIKVPKNAEAVLAAATSLGDKTMNSQDLLEVVGDKLESALRDVGAKTPLDELNSNRDQFASSVQEIIVKELEPNGLQLETVTILHLDQTSPENLRPDTNVFDAEGARTVAEITQKQRVERNKIEREADKSVKAQDVERDQFVYLQEVERAKAEADASAKKQKAGSLADQEAASYAAEQAKLTGVARAQSQQDVEVAEVVRQRAIEVANEQRQQAAREAEIAKQQATEVADRRRQIAVAAAERERAAAEQAQLEAEQEREAADQAVKTVQETAQADRAKQVTVINQMAAAEQQRIRDNTSADIAAYQAAKEAEGRQEAAERDAAARRVRAAAEQEALIAEAAGQRAVQMIPVEVERESVAVRRDDLKNKAEFDTIARDLEIRLAEIAANRDAKIEAAKAMGVAMAQANVTIWSDPDAYRRMTESFLAGQANGQYLEGLSSATPEELRTLAQTAGAGGVELLKRLGLDLTKLVTPSTAASNGGESATSLEK
jgi:uncharacterized membrane protein YqiK